MKFSSFYEFKKEQLPRQLYEEIRYAKIATATPTQSTQDYCNSGWISDGYHDEINNNMDSDCNFDGRDCCG